MQRQGIKLIITGIIVIVFSGLERILLFTSFQWSQFVNYNTIVNLTPSSIWNIPQHTLAFGICILLIGVFISIGGIQFFRKQFEIMEQRNAEFESKNDTNDKD